MRIYLDSAPVIYTVEQVLPFAVAVDARLGAAGVVLVTSELARMECIVQPLRTGNTALLQDFDAFFSARIAEWSSLHGQSFSGLPRSGHSSIQDARCSPSGSSGGGGMRRLSDE